jgi:hypothetical protein
MWCLSNLKKGIPRSPSRERNLFRAVIQLLSFWTSLIIHGALMAVMAVIFSKFASIPLGRSSTTSSSRYGT